MKKTLFLIVLFAAIAGVTFYFLTERGGSSSGLTSVLSGGLSGQSSPPRGDLPSDSLISMANDQTLFAFVINPRKLDPLGDHFTKVREKFSQTSLWKKLSLDQMIEAQLSSVVPPAGPTSLPGSPQEMFELLRAEWSAVKELGVLVIDKVFPAGAGTELPKTLVSLQFVDANSTQHIRKLIDENLLGGQPSKIEGGVTFAKDPKNTNRYVFVTELDAEGSKFGGALEFVNERVYLTVGTGNEAEFLSTKAGGLPESRALVDSPIWDDASHGVLPEAGIVIISDNQKLYPLLDKLSAMGLGEALDPTGGLVPTSMFSNSPFVKGIGAASMSLDVTNGVGYRTCTGLRKDSPFYEAYRKLLYPTAPSRNSSAEFQKLLGDKTLFATELSAIFLQLYSEVIRNGNNFLPATATEENKQQWQEFEAKFKELEKHFADIKLASIGVFVDAPRPEQLAVLMQPGGVPPTPDFGILFSFEKSVELGALSNSLNEVAKNLAGDSGLIELPIASVSSLPSPSGGSPVEVVQLNLGPAATFYGARFGDTQVLFGKDLAFIEGAKSQAARAPLIDEAVLASRGLGGTIPSSDAYALISTGPIIEIARSFVPMAMMMVPPDAGVNVNEVEEVLSLLSVKLFMIQNSQFVGEEVICSSGRGIAL